LGDATSRVLHAIESPEDHALLVVAEHDREQFVGTTGVEGKPVTGSEHHRGTSLFYLAATPSGPIPPDLLLLLMALEYKVPP